MSQNSPSLLDLIRTTFSSRKHLRFYILRMFVDKDEIILIKRRKGRQGEEEEASVHSATGTKDHRLGNILTHTHTHTHRRFFSQFWRLRCPSSRHQHGYALVKALFWLTAVTFLPRPHTMNRARELCENTVIAELIPAMIRSSKRPHLLVLYIGH